jgi:hypothetical protein
MQSVGPSEGLGVAAQAKWGPSKGRFQLRKEAIFLLDTQRVQNIERRSWIRPNRDVSLCHRIPNDPFLIEDKSSGQRKCPRIVAIQNREIEPHTAVVALLFLGKSKTDSERVCDLIAGVAQKIERQALVLAHGSAVLRQLWRNDHQGRAEGC